MAKSLALNRSQQLLERWPQLINELGCPLSETTLVCRLSGRSSAEAPNGGCRIFQAYGQPNGRHTASRTAVCGRAHGRRAGHLGAGKPSASWIQSTSGRWLNAYGAWGDQLWPGAPMSPSARGHAGPVQRARVLDVPPPQGEGLPARSVPIATPSRFGGFLPHCGNVRFPLVLGSFHRLHFPPTRR